MNLENEIIENLKREGCGIFGFADLSALPEEPRKGLPSAVVMGTFYSPKAVSDRMKSTPDFIAGEFNADVPRLERYRKAAMAALKNNKFKANITYSTTAITFKTLATLAGIGWIGRCALLVTDKVGPALRLTAVLTNAPLKYDAPILKSKCPPGCDECFDACPTNAVKEGLWERGIHRDAFFDVEACKKGRNKCDTICIASCPFTKKALGYA